MISKITKSVALKSIDAYDSVLNKAKQARKKTLADEGVNEEEIEKQLEGWNKESNHVSTARNEIENLQELEDSEEYDDPKYIKWENRRSSILPDHNEMMKMAKDDPYKLKSILKSKYPDISEKELNEFVGIKTIAEDSPEVKTMKAFVVKLLSDSEKMKELVKDKYEHLLKCFKVAYPDSSDLEINNLLNQYR